MDSIALFFAILNEERESANRRIRSNLRKNAMDVMELPDEIFIKTFRLNKSAFNYVVSLLRRELLPNIRTDSLTPKTKLVCCMRFFAEGSIQHDFGKDYNICIAQSTFSKVLAEVLTVLEKKLCPKWISLNMTGTEKQEANQWFFEKSKIPKVIMCMDGTHINIKRPAENSILYCNKTNRYSLNTVLVCDHKQQIRFVDARFGGSNDNSLIWSNCEASSYFAEFYQSGDHNRLLADKRYPNMPWMLTPFLDVEPNSRESLFNENHSNAHNIIKKTISALRNRFQCLSDTRILQYEPKKAVQIINVCCALHNVCLYFKSYWKESEETEPKEELFDDDDDLIESDEESLNSIEATRLRNEIMNSL